MKRYLLLAALAAAAALPGTALGAGAVLHHDHKADYDSRTGSVDPTAPQRSRAADLGAAVRWNRFGTPQSVIKYGGYLAQGLGGEPAEAARSFLRANAVLFRLSSEAVDRLELLNDVTLRGTSAHVVTFRQRFGDLPAAQDGLITVSVVDGKVSYVSSSAVGERAAPGGATLSAAEAWVRAAGNAGLSKSLVDVTATKQEAGWTVLTVGGLAYPQQARLVAFPTLDGVRATWEANVVRVGGGEAEAYTSFVDAQSGEILFRRNAVDNADATQSQEQAGAFNGEFGKTTCGPKHPFDVAAGTKTIDVVVNATVPTNDIVVRLYGPSGVEVTHSDVLTSPEVVHYAPDDLLAGSYAVEVCPFDNPIVPFVPPLTYTGTFTTSSAPVNVVTNVNPKWSVFPANPPLDYASTDTRVLWCWIAASSCAMTLENPASAGPWDYDHRTNTPTFTSKGNNASTAEAWASPLTPAEQYRAASPGRTYTFPWTNQWYASKCSPTVFASAGRNDIDAAIANLFAMHNRMHDWSYHLGFTERTYNLQDVNHGKTAPGPFPGREADPELGDAQAGAVTGGQPSLLGRDNANQITLQDGVAPITNMYLWQPIAGAFYAPCVDGDYDMSVIGHEYTHAITNRMIGGPDANITGNQGRAMGESWSDLAAVEYLNEYGFVPTGGDDPFAVGPYVTGNKVTGIRNYNMRNSPLNYSDVGYDFVCNANDLGNCVSMSQVHADGEIWSATNYDIRQALIAKHGAGSPELQRDCADGKVNASQCSGNRRWAQIMFDAFLLMPAAVTMVDARDAYLAADVNRFGGANQQELWHVFASRGFGVGAVSQASPADDDHDNPIPSFESPLEEEAVVTFDVTGLDGPLVPPKAKVFVGHYEARVTPIADTDPATELDAVAALVPGTYDFVVQAPGYGLSRFRLTLAAGPQTQTFTLNPNWASQSKGATIGGDGVNQTSLIDDTESTNWAALGRSPNVADTKVTIDLSGGERLVNLVKVSAMLRQRDPTNATDSGGQNRFTALRQFEIWTCNANDPGKANCLADGAFSRIYVSPEDAFPAGIPRPLAPNLIVRTFDVPDTLATHLRLVVRTNQCMGQPAYRGEQDNDPANNTDCVEASARETEVRAAELEVFSALAGVANP